MDVFSLVAKLSLDSSEYKSELNESKSLLSGVGSAASKGFGVVKTAAKAGAIAIGVATTAVAAFVKSSVSVGAKFDKAMSQVAATMGTTTDEIQELREFAIQMGSETAFSATEAADALNYMALAGYSAEESMNMLPTVLNLAAAGNIDLASASDMVTDAQSALGLSFEETAEMVDKMATASSKSNTSVEQLGDAFLTVGGTAKDLKGGTTELATVLGILADNGIKGSEGGTALRNIILALEAPTDKAAEAMKELGLEVFDANGNMRPMEEIFGDLNSQLSTMTQGERTEVLSEIFNKVDLKSVNSLLATNVDRWGELTDAIDNSQGAAEKMASTQLDNLEGDVTLFKSALEGAQIAISDKVTPTLREFVQFGTESVGSLTKAFQEDGLNGAMTALGDIITDGTAKLIDGLPAFVDAGIQLLGSIASGIIQNLPALYYAVIQITNSIIDKIKAVDWATVGTTIWNWLKGAFNKAASWFKGIFTDALQKVRSINWTGLGSKIWSYITLAIKGAVDWFKNLFDSVSTKIKEIDWEDVGQKIWDWISGAFTSVVQWFKDLFSKDRSGGVAYEVEHIDWAGLGKSILDFIVSAFSAIATVYTTIFQKAWDAIKNIKWADLGKAIWEFIKSAFLVVKDWLKDKFNEAWTAIKSIDWKDLGTQIWKAIKDGAKGIKTWFKDRFRDAWDAITAIDWGAVGDTIWEKIKTALSGFGDWLKGIFKTPINAVIGFVNDMLSKIESGVNAVVDKLNTLHFTIGGGSFMGMEIPQATIGISGLGHVSFGRLSYLSNGGVLGNGGQAIVGEYAPEYLRVVNGQAVVAPIKNAARFGSEESNITINIYSQPGQDVDELAEKVEKRLVDWEKQRRLAYA